MKLILGTFYCLSGLLPKGLASPEEGKSHFSQAPVGTHSVIKELSVGKVSSFVQKEVEASAFDLQWQHGRNFTSMGHAGNLGQGNCETGPQAKRGVSGQCHLLPSCKEHD